MGVGAVGGPHRDTSSLQVDLGGKLRACKGIIGIMSDETHWYKKLLATTNKKRIKGPT